MSHDVAAGDRYVEGAAFWASTPAFVYRPPSLGSALAEIVTPLLLLLAWCSVGTLAAATARRGLRP